MTQEEILQYNKMCAEFLDLHRDEEVAIYKLNAYPYEYLRFDSDWNWIMEVINKAEDIETVGQRVYFTINPFEISVYCSGVLEKNLTVLSFTLKGQHFKGEFKKEAVLESINQFLIWYNQNKTI